MADYYTHTVVQQTIPERLISPLERLLLANIFTREAYDDGVYYFADTDPNIFIVLDRPELRRALDETRVRSRIRSFVERCLAASGNENSNIDLDLSAVDGGNAHIVILQDIVRRSKGEIPYLTLASAFTCSKMRPDGFGGMGIIITAKRVLYQSTYEFFESFERRHLRRQQAAAQTPP